MSDNDVQTQLFSEDEEEEDDIITEAEIAEHKQILAQYIDEELKLKSELKEVRKFTNPARKRIKQYIEQEDLEEFRVSDSYSIVAQRKPAITINKSTLLSSKVITGKKRKLFLQECTAVKIAFKENSAWK